MNSVEVIEEKPVRRMTKPLAQVVNFRFINPVARPVDPRCYDRRGRVVTPNENSHDFNVSA
jgi:hypothetical protein